MITIKRVEKTKISNNKNIGRSIEIKQKVNFLSKKKQHKNKQTLNLFKIFI